MSKREFSELKKKLRFELKDQLDHTISRFGLSLLAQLDPYQPEDRSKTCKFDVELAATPAGKQALVADSVRNTDELCEYVLKQMRQNRTWETRINPLERELKDEHGWIFIPVVVIKICDKMVLESQSQALVRTNKTDKPKRDYSTVFTNMSQGDIRFLASMKIGID